MATLIPGTLALAYGSQLADTAPACIHGNAPEHTNASPMPRRPKNNISLNPVFILLPTSITDWDIESGRNSRYQIMALGIRHLLDRVPLTGPTSRQLLWAWSTWFIQSKVPIESHQRPTPFLLCLTGWSTKQVSKCYSVIAVNNVSTSFFISYHLSCIPTIIPLVTAFTSAKWFCENIN